MKTSNLVLAWGFFVCLGAAQSLPAQERDRKVRDDRKQFESDESWVYNDLEAGLSAARKSGQPLFVVFRCIPCEACAGIDDRVAHRDPAIRELLKQYVCVRVPQANTLDLSRFQFDFDLSMGAFFMNADGTLYGRYGTPVEREDASNDKSLQALSHALRTALELHAGYPANRESLAAKQSAPSRIGDATYRKPQDFPTLAKYETSLNWTGAVAKSCVHCHQIRDAERLIYRDSGEPMPDKALYPWPMPETVGMSLDPAQRAHVTSVKGGSPAEAAGFKPGDDLLTIAGQTLVSITDVQWVLHNCGDEQTLAVDVRRGDQPLELTLRLPSGWRKASDISWRVSTWELRRMATGGLKLEAATPEQRQAAGVADGQLALYVKGVGQYGAHAVAKQAGVQQGDVIVSFDKQTSPMSEVGLLAYAVQHTKPKDVVEVIVARKGQRHTLKLPMQ